MRNEIFVPLGMRSTWVEAPAAGAPRLATGYGFDDDSLIPQPYEWYVTTPASSIDATAADMGRLLQDLLVGHLPILDDTLTARVPTERLFGYGDLGAYSWGLWDEQAHGHRILHHGGIVAGFSTELYLVPDRRSGFFIAYNRDPETGPDPELREKLTSLFLEQLLGDDPEPATPHPDSTVATSQYAGVYASGVGCFTCAEGEGWTLSTVPVESTGPGALSIGGWPSYAVGHDVFVRRAPAGPIHFLRDASGHVSYMVSGPRSYVRMDSTMLDRVLGAGWQTRPPTTLEARMHRVTGQWQESGDAFASLAQRDPANGRDAFYAGFGFLNAGDHAAAIRWFREAVSRTQWLGWSHYYIGAAQAASGQRDPAWAELDAAIDAGFGDVGALKRDPWWSKVRDTPQFRAAVARLGG